MTSHTREEIQDAFAWVAWWETGIGEPDRLDNQLDNTTARRILGDHSYQLLVNTAQTWARQRVGT